MNITHVVENLNRGGLERVVIDLIAVQQAAGHRCQVVCLFERGALAAELDAHGVPVIACGKRSGFDLAAVRRMRAAIRAHGTEVLNTHNSMAHYYAAIATLGLRLRRINTRHSMGVSAHHRRRDWLYRASMLGTDAVIAVSRASCEAALAQHLVPADKAVAIPNGIPIGAFRSRSAEARQRLAESLGLPADVALLGTVGRLHPAKDHALLLRAFAQLVAGHPHTALIVVGDGALRADLEREAQSLGIAGRVRFLGDRGDVKALLCAFDLFVLSSRTEGYSIALVEACAAGLPIVATAVGGNPEIVRDGRNGRIVPPGDADALVAAIAGLLEDVPRRESMGEAARAWALANGSVEAMAERYEAVYRGARLPDAASASR